MQAMGRVQQRKRDQNRGKLNDKQVTSRADKRARQRATRRARRRATRRARRRIDEQPSRGLRRASAGAAECRGSWEARAAVARAALCARPQWRPQQRKARRQRRLAASNRPKPRVNWHSTGLRGVDVPLGHEGRLDHRRSDMRRQAASVSSMAELGTTRRTWLWWVAGFVVLAGMTGGLCVSSERGFSPICIVRCVPLGEGASALVYGTFCGLAPRICTVNLSSRRTWVVES